MPKTFDEILSRFVDDHAYDSDDVIEALKETREAVGGDPSEWWVEDADGNRVHIGDNVKNYHSDALKVVDFGYRFGRRTVEYGDGFDYADTVRKIIPDTREKIIEDTLAKLGQTGMYQTSLVTESVEQAIDRAMKLGAEQ